MTKTILKQPKILCTTCKQPIKITKKPDVPRIATKPYCSRCYYKKKDEIKSKKRNDGSGRLSKLRKKYLWSN
jgi:hypothetical protein